MIETLQGQYFFPHASRFVPARLEVRGNALAVIGADGAVIVEQPVRKVRISSRLGNLVRRFDFPDGGCFQTNDNDAVDAFLAHHFRRSAGRTHRLERNLKLAVFALLVTVGVMAALVFYGIPFASLKLAQITPQSWADRLGRDSLAVMDGYLFKPSKLPVADREKINAAFAEVEKTEKRHFRLLVRDSEALGPNAVALPDGTIVMTDALWKIAKDRREIQGVLAHEMAHVQRRHSLQAVYQASFIPALIAIVTGDASSFGNLATILPTILIASSYSRSLEQQADDDSAATMRKIGQSPSHLADILERIEKENCKKDSCGPSWLGSHPETSERAKRLRQR